MKEEIYVKGAKENNLKNVDVHIPRNTLTVFTGLSGSGKSTLAFDTIFAEGQRRYMESLSSYARQFLGMMEKPDVESIEGLSPAISIDQKTTSHNPRSTVGTVTEIYDYLRLLFARVGVPHCPKCGREIRRQTVDEIADKVMAMPDGSKIMVTAPVVRGRKGEYVKELAGYRKSGFVRVKIDGSIYELQEEIRLDKNVKHNIGVVVDRLVVKEGILKRLTESLETAFTDVDTARYYGAAVAWAVEQGVTNGVSQTQFAPHQAISRQELVTMLYRYAKATGQDVTGQADLSQFVDAGWQAGRKPLWPGP